jgi:hypothetical protein
MPSQRWRRRRAIAKPTAAVTAANPQGALAPEPTAMQPPPPLLEEPELPLLLDPVPELLPDPLPLLDEPPELLLELPPPAPPSSLTKVQFENLQTAPCALHLQSVSTVHQPGDWAAGLHIWIGALVQSHTSEPHAVPFAVHSMSFMQDVAPAEAVHNEVAAKAVPQARRKARNSMAILL